MMNEEYIEFCKEFVALLSKYGTRCQSIGGILYVEMGDGHVDMTTPEWHPGPIPNDVVILNARSKQ